MLILLDGERAMNWAVLYRSPNYHVRSNLAKKKHALVISEVERQHNKPYLFHDRVAILIIGYFKGNMVDPDNICSKVYIDGLVKAGLLNDDSAKWVESVTTISRKDNARQRVEIWINPAMT